MLASFRRLSKTKVGTIIMALFLLAIVASFALTDISSVTSGSLGQSSSTLVSVGGEEVTDRDIQQAMERRLAEVRQQNPEATYADIAGDFDSILASLVDRRTLEAFAAKNGFHVSKRLVDAEIANIPGTRGLDGKFSEAAYAAFLAQQRLSDAEVRNLISSTLLQRMLLTPVVTNGRVPVGMATPYASMLLEAREGQVATIPASAFRAGLNPTDADLQRFYAANRNRYMVPEQRSLRIARIGPEQVANVAATDQEIANFYRANQATYGPKEIRVLSQAVVPDRATAEAIARRARSGASFVEAAAPAGLSAADISVGPQNRAEFASLAGDSVASAAFAAESGAIVGPVQSDLGWHVVKIDSIEREGGKSLAEARAEIAARLSDEKRQNALTDLVTRIEDDIASGSNFAEAVASGNLSATQTPLITAGGVARGDPSFRFPQELGPALQAAFEMEASDDPEVVQLAGESSFALVAPAQIVPAAPAPLPQIREQVAADWIVQQANERARAVANAIAAKVARNVPLAEAVRQAGVALPPVREIAARRIQLSQMGEQVPAAVRMLFSLGEGKSRMVADPQNRGYSVVKVNEITPGNALSQPALIGQVQSEFRDAVTQEYARQFMASVSKAVRVDRNESAIAAAKQRITGS